MASHFHHHGPSRADIARGHEANDVGIRGFIWFGVAFVGGAAVIHTIVWFLLLGTQQAARAENAARFPPPLFSQPTMAVVSRPPPPNLQPSREHPRVAWRDMDDLRHEQEDSLAGIDPKFGRGWEHAYTDAVREPSQPLNQLRLPPDAVDAVAPRIKSSQSGAPSSQPTTQRGEAAAATPPGTEGTKE
jgi:hypothetical protein